MYVRNSRDTKYAHDKYIGKGRLISIPVSIIENDKKKTPKNSEYGLTDKAKKFPNIACTLKETLF